mgnify:CR=1 FL=1
MIKNFLKNNLYEFWIASRYTHLKSKNFISFISLTSIIGISLGVMALIVVLSVMNGFRAELKNKILYRASYRGTKEMDILMTKFVKSIIDDLNIDGGTDIGADLVDADEIIVDDGGGGTNRRSDLTRVKKYVYSAMSGDATASDAGAVTIANDAVESGMLNDNVISGQTALTSGLATTDELLVSDGGTLKRMDVSLILNSAADEATALAIALG